MPDPLSRLYDDHAQALYAFLFTQTYDEAESHDVLQDLFCKLARRPAMLDGIRNERAFLLRVAHRIVIDRARNRSARTRRHEVIAAEAGVHRDPAPGDEKTFQTALDDAIAALPPEQRAVVHLKLRTGLTFAEIADVLDLSQNTAASRYRYALDKLRNQLRPLYEELK